MHQKLPKVIAHRGGRHWAPENTMAAFQKSLDLGVWGIELDIHRCKSGELVVIHDTDLARTTNGSGLVKDISYPELKCLSAGLWYDPAFADERIPTLQEVLDLSSGKTMLNIEIKNTPIDYPGIDDDLIDLLGAYPFTETLIISSFDHQIIRRLHSKAPNLKLALLADALMVDIGEYALKLGATLWHPGFWSLRPEAVEEAHQAGLGVNVWTINSTGEWDEAIRWGIDGIVTDNPVGLTEHLHQLEAVRR